MKYIQQEAMDLLAQYADDNFDVLADCHLSREQFIKQAHDFISNENNYKKFVGEMNESFPEEDDDPELDMHSHHRIE